MARTRFPKPWPMCGHPARSDALAVAPRALRACACGAVHTFVALAGCGDGACLSVRVWCRAHFCRFGRLRGWGVFERARVVPRTLLSLSRGRLRGSGMFEHARVVPCALLSLSRGRLRGSGVFEACRGHAAAPCHWDC